MPRSSSNNSVGSQRPRAWRYWRDLPASLWVNLSWTLSILTFLILLPIDGLSPWPMATVSLWAAVNLILTVSFRAVVETAIVRRTLHRATSPSADAESPTTMGPEEGAAALDDTDSLEEDTGEGAADLEASADDDKALVQGTSLFRDALRRLRRNQLATICIGLLGTLFLLCTLHRVTYELVVWQSTGSEFFADIEASEFFRNHIDHTRIDKTNTFGPPTAEHWFGTDHLGRDVFARTLYGGSISFLVAFVGTIVSLLIGVTWGSVSGYYGGRLDHYMMRVVDVLYGLPFMFLVILIMSLVNGLHITAGEVRPHVEEFLRLLGHSSTEAATYAREHSVDWNARAAVFLDDNVPPMVVMFVALGMVQWLTMARIVRGQVLSLREREFVVAARLMGARTRQILWKHIIPNLLGPVIVYTTLTIPTIMLAEAFLSFLGLGISEPDCSWGSLAAEGIDAMNMVRPYWWLLTYPAAALCLALFSLNFAGDGLRDALDPRRRR